MTRKLLSLAIPLAASAALLSMIQAPVDWSFLAWAAMVPFALACRPEVRPRTLALVAMFVGTIYWLANIYWIAPITIAGWLAMGIYLALLWPLLALAIRFCRARNIPMALALPILVVGAERLQGFPLGGFFWRLLGHSQYANLALIQIADLFGVAGVSFLVAAVNGVLADWIAWRTAGVWQPQSRRLWGRPVPGAIPKLRLRLPLIALVAIMVVATWLYGHWRISQTAEVVTDGPLVAALQSNVPQSVKISHAASDELFAELLEMSRAAAAAGAELIAWPETMVQAYLQPELWRYFEDPNEDRAFHEALIAHATDTAYLLVGAYGGEIMKDPQGKLYIGQYNAAYLYRPDGTKDPNRYDKIHLVLFGEYIPFRRSFNWLYQQLKRFAPEEYNYDYSLEHGRHYTVYEMTTPVRGTEPNVASQTSESTYRFGTIICYEDAIPYVARNFTLDDKGRKRVDWLVNISNDGWFVRFLDAPPRVVPSTELPQHAAICVFRAVENRLPVLRSVNTGISCLIDSSGRIRNAPIASSEGFPPEAMRRTGLSGWFLEKMPIDSRVTFYSRHGQWLDTGCAVAFVTVLIVPAVIGLARRRARKPTKKPA
ncbi:MAG: apolipoprotein N-acyltransferase [Sedimentisphaerales bacterium]|jgi:apolipoprotein N-acyltransferase|nr:apolipoprotein N-acyltransferase [Sedimentisphaerales bacterium]HNY79010.1 apolipoprotein N-acyltransferase [Sedimentisphaerales bacterium]HOC64041.1 apolipoprotein N-acyltransferase [Sedimentisphaerales bacterium]HOH64924.1 apolipoprotein N-acyltransferase [Sedimentisphaerales bacterium]HPY51302.1 apolipoprotein N-acyltransferase [Sedimentisphaerales bacterium]